MADENTGNEIDETVEETPVEETAAESVDAPDAEAATADAPEAEAEAEEKVARRGGRRRGRTDGSDGSAPVAPQRVRAQAKYVRTSARKARLVCDHIRGKSVADARALLLHSPRSVARDWSKLLESAVANAEHNNGIDAEQLRVIAIAADEGPTLKRYRPRAMGRATKIRKRTCHLTIVLGTGE